MARARAALWHRGRRVRRVAPRRGAVDGGALLQRAEGRGGQAGARRRRRVDHRPATGARAVARGDGQAALGRQERSVEGEPARRLDRARRLALHRPSRRPVQRAARPRLRVDRVRPLHAAGPGTRGALGRDRQDRVRPPRMSLTPDNGRPGARGLTLWFTGLSGAGKSTVAQIVERRLRERGERVEVLDGDVVRTNLSKGLGFSKEDRDTNIRRIAFVADLLSRNGVVAITAAISPYREIRDEARGKMGERFVEVYVKASVEECARRDVKGLYDKAFKGEIKEFTGVSDPYEEPSNPELVVDTEELGPEEAAQKIIQRLEQLGLVRAAVSA